MTLQNNFDMSAELRLKKLRGSGGYIMAKISDQQQSKGNLGGPDLFLAPIGRLEVDKILKYTCNSCEKEFEGSPKIEFENPNEEVAENLVLVERGQYICNGCDSTIAEYREFKKENEQTEVGDARTIKQEMPQMHTQVNDDIILDSKPIDSTFSSISGKDVFDENANQIGKAKQVGVDSQNSVVLVITTNEGDDIIIKWEKIKKIT